MDLGWLEDYLALRELGSFTAAAERRNLSQPAFSRRIQSLEAWLGVTLIDRTCRPHRLTAVALENHVDLHRSLNQLYELRCQLRGEQARASRLKVAVQHSLAISLFPRLVEDLRRNGYQPAYHLNCADRSGCIEMMLRNEVDLLICYEVEQVPAVVAGATAVRLAAGRDDMILVGPPDATLSQDQQVQLLTYPQSTFFGEIIWEQVMPQLTTHFTCETVCISAFSGALREMVLAGLGLAWLPRSLITGDLAAGRLAALDPDRMRHPMVVALYARSPAGNASDIALWQHLTQIDVSRLIA